ncbi:TonB-dependent receptor [Winogradskyella sp. SYSU M77433]|uniref:TonB-dependent receptor n=1 Tax=Winogradskyella sp. SYSU M77433 TaxID=3042722 RepID=UPI0024808906|nr:TonB-dependent receptor [Winogradskyella sp. SYSU M77433]MDH7913447.1 TonB-dependent receptor [Winogradskyella sp. SYSU M77433]
MPPNKYLLLLLLFFFSIAFLQGQDNDQENKLPIENILTKIETAHNVIFNYKSGLLDDIVVFEPRKDLDLSAKIESLHNQTNLVFTIVSKAIITISKPIKICAYLKDEYLQEPLEGATITSDSKYTISDKDGYFELELNSLDDMLSIRFIGFKTIERQARYFDLEQCSVITMSEHHEMISTVLLKAYLVQGIDKDSDWTTSIDYSEFTLLPGLIESDVLQTVQALPSILSTDETVSNLNIRGGSNDQNLILWDNIKMYQTGHFFGLMSSFNPHMTQKATIINNGSDVSFTDGVSGTIHMKTDRKINSDFEGIFGINFLNAELFTNIPISEKSSLQVASRKSLDEFVRTPTYKVYFDRITQDNEIQNNNSEIAKSDQEFNFYDASLRWLYNPSEKDFIRLNFIHNSNDLSFNETTELDDNMITRQSKVSQSTLGFGLNYTRKWNKEFETIINTYNSDYKLQSLNADIVSNQLFLQENIVSETGIKVQNIYTKNLWKLKLGYDFTETKITNLNDIDLPRFVRRDEEVLREHAVYGQAKFSNAANDFAIRAGIRGNYITKFQKAIVEPRLSIRKALGNHIEIEALGEFKHQNVSQIVNFQNDFLGIEKRRWQLTENDSIPIIKSKQASFGILYKNKGWLLDSKLYYKTVDGITTQSQSFTTKYEFAREQGSYNAYGFEFLCRKKLNDFNNWLSYSYINNKYTFEDLEEIEFPSNFDITHSFALGSTYSTDSWNISAGINYRIGKPTSIPIKNNEIEDGDINWDVANGERLKDYLRIDASTLYKFKISSTFRSEVGASVWNISDRKNAINNYFRTNDSDSVDKFSRFSLGLTTNAVFRLYF